MTEASAKIPTEELGESIYNIQKDYDEQPLIQKDSHNVYISKNHDNVGEMIHNHEQRQPAQKRVRISRPKQRPSSAYGVERGHYYGGYTQPMTGRRDANGYHHGRFLTAKNARNGQFGSFNRNGGGVMPKWNEGYQMIANSIQKVASGMSYSQSQRQLAETRNSKVRIQDGHDDKWETNTFDNEMPYDQMQHSRGAGPSVNSKSVRFNGYNAPRRPQSALGPRYRGLTRAQSTPFIEPGQGFVADNNTFQDFKSNASEKTNKLKKNLYGKTYGNYSNRPLTSTQKRRKRPLIHHRRGPKGQAQGRQLAISKDLRNFYEEKNFRDSLYFDSRTGEVPKRKGNNQMVEGLMRYRKSIEGQPRLHGGMMKLKQIQLLKNKRNKVKTTKHWPHNGYIYNDYHDKSTKDGYSRNSLGTFFYH